MIVTIQIDQRDLKALDEALRVSPFDYDLCRDNSGLAPEYAKRLMLARRALSLSTQYQCATTETKP